MPKAKEKSSSLRDIEEDLASIEGSGPRPDPPPEVQSALERLISQQQSHNDKMLQIMSAKFEAVTTVVKESVKVKPPVPVASPATASVPVVPIVPNGLFNEVQEESMIGDDSEDDDDDFFGWEFPSAAQEIHQEEDDPMSLPAGPSANPDQV